MKACIISLLVFFSLCCYSQSELIKAFDANDLAKVKSIIDLNPELINKESEYSTYPLFIAAEKLKIDIARYLIEKGANVDARTSRNGDNIILYLARTMWYPGNAKRAKEYIELIDLFASLKVSCTTTGKDGYGPIYLAALKGNVKAMDMKNYMEIINACIKNGAKITDKGNGCTLHVLLKARPAANGKVFDFGNFEVAKEFVAIGADINEVDGEKNTPLHAVLLSKFATDEQKADIVRFLIEKGARTNVKNGAGKTPEDLVKKESPLYEIMRKTKPKK